MARGRRRYLLRPRARSRPTCKPRSVRGPLGSLRLRLLPARGPRATISLGRHLTMRLKQPTRGSMEWVAPRPCGRRPCLALLRAGVAWPPHYCGRRWSLTPPFHPYRTVEWSRDAARAAGAVLEGSAVSFCGPFHGFPRPGVTRRSARWSADFPRTAICRPRSPGRPGSNHIIILGGFPVNSTCPLPAVF